MKTCQNISLNYFTYKQFDQYIKPALGALCCLTKYSDDYNYVNERAIFIYYNIIVMLNQASFNNNPDLENELNKYSFMDNFCEILKKYFIENNKKITAEIVKKLLKIINIIFKVSKKFTDKILSLNFLEIIEEIIHHEFNDVITSKNNAISISNSNLNESNNKNTAKSSSSFIRELFLLLISLLSDNKDEKKNMKGN